VSRRFHDRNVYGSKSLIKKRFQSKRIADRISTRTSKNCCCNHFGGWADDTKIEKYKEKLKQPWTLKE
jgi:hypothetical protein